VFLGARASVEQAPSGAVAPLITGFARYPNAAKSLARLLAALGWPVLLLADGTHLTDLAQQHLPSASGES
jgi:hypothetical protein